jgi:hypothetical protein
MSTDYKERLKIPVNGANFQLYTKSGELIANRYDRVVIGKRGPYIEVKNDYDLVLSNLKQVMDADSAEHYYFEEWRSLMDDVMVYHQLHGVDYADYRVGSWYVSPFELRFRERKTGGLTSCIEPIVKKSEQLDMFKR